MLDKNVIMARLARLDEYAFRLRRFESISLEEYLGDYDIQAIVERNLQLSISWKQIDMPFGRCQNAIAQA